MVNIEIPRQYTASPSSFIGTPHLTINCKATIDLDSTNAFEGMFHILYEIFILTLANINKGLRNYWKYGSVLHLRPYLFHVARVD